MIRSENIDWDDSRPYHTIPMVHTLLEMYLGLQTRVLSPHFTQERVVVDSLPKPEQIDASYQSCSRDMALGALTHHTYERLVTSNHSFIQSNNSKSPYHILVHGRMLWVSFGVGYRSSFSTLDQAIPLPDEEEDEEYRQNLVVWLEHIQHIYDTHSIDTLVLCGHSYGMRCATISSFFLECMVNPVFRDRHSRICGSFSIPDQEHYSFDDYAQHAPCISSLTRYVVGTGGRPVLFLKEDEFHSYFIQVQGRYAHIVSGIQRNDMVYMDMACKPIESTLHEGEYLQNYKFQCYYEEEHEDSDSEKRYKHHQCFSPRTKRYISTDIEDIFFIEQLHSFHMYRVILSIFFYGRTTRDSPVPGHISRDQISNMLGRTSRSNRNRGKKKKHKSKSRKKGRTRASSRRL